MKVLNKYSLFLIFSLLMLANLSCTKEAKLIAERDKEPTFDNTPLGQKQKEFYEKYNTLFQYKWDRHVFARDAFANPASIEDVLPYMEMLEIVFFKAMDAVSTNKKFSNVNTPLSFYLIGSGINYGWADGGGESSVGQAGNIQPNRLTLGGLTNFGKLVREDTKEEFNECIYNHADFSSPVEAGVIGFIYHEYTHYLNSRFDIPRAFAVSAAHNYLKGTNAFVFVSDSLAYERGFFLPYGMQNEMEDFATYVQIMIWKSPEYIQKEIIKNSMSLTKYNEVNKYFNRLGIDLNKLRTYLQSKEVKDQLLALKSKYEIKN